MQLRAKRSMLICALVLSGHSLSAFAQLPPPPPPPTTLWSFLGIPQGMRYVRDNTLNRSGNRPGLERQPPLKPIADPKNLESKDPAIKKAAEVKQAEDLKKQKIKAVKYLASIGCGCYNRDGSITDALLKSMDDCTEEVRLATVQAISEAAVGEKCANCKMRSCCSEEISNKLYEIAYERDETGCYLEPSERVRQAAAEALRTCCNGGNEDLIMDYSPAPTPAAPGEQPGVVPEVGGERPGDVPPATTTLPITPIPVTPAPVVTPPPPAIIAPPPPAAPLQNPAPIVPPRITPPAPAPASINGNQSSRRTASVKPQPVSTAMRSDNAVTFNASRQSSIVRSAESRPVPPVVIEPRIAEPQSVRVNPHWKPVDEQQSVFFRHPASGPLPIEDAGAKISPENVVVNSLPQRPGKITATPAKLDSTLGLAPVVTRASMTRLPPVDHSTQANPTFQTMPSPPLPGSVTPVVTSVSVTRPRASANNSAVVEAPASVLTTSSPQPTRRPFGG
jgi:hypothetical protein